MSEYQPEAGQWRLISPSGAEYEADSPMRCVRAWTDANVPSAVQLQRIRAMCAPTLEDKAELDAHRALVQDACNAAFECGEFSFDGPDEECEKRDAQYQELINATNAARDAVRASALKLMGLSDE